MASFFPNFCGTQDWRLNETWHSDTPDFSHCFQETLLVWIPCVFLWICSPYEVFRLYRSDEARMPWTVINVTKFALCILLVIMNCIEFVYSLVLFTEGYVYPVFYFSPFIKIFTFILSSALLYMNRVRGQHTSAILFLFWLLFTISGAIKYRSLILIAFYDGEYDGVSNDTIYALKFAYTPIFVLQFILSCFADSRPKLKMTFTETNAKCPERLASILSILLFWWVNPIILLGYKRPLTKEDMWTLSKANTTEENARLFDETTNPKPKIDHKINLEKETINPNKANSDKPKFRGILFPLVKTYWLYLIFLGVIKFVISFLPYINPILLDYLITYMSNDEPYWRGYFYAGLMFVSPLVESLITSQYEMGISTVGMRIRSCVTNSIYKKSLNLSSSGRKQFTIGEIVNLMAIDTQRVMEFVLILNETWSSPLQMAIALYLLWAQLGIATLAGFGAMLVLIPINGYITGKMRVIHTHLMKHKDRRIKLMNEILSGVKVLKLYAWETSFIDQVMSMRNKEIERLTTRAWFQGGMVFIFNSAPFMVAISSFATFILIDDNNILTPSKAFVSLALFNQLRFPLNMLPRLITFYVMFIVSIRRLNKYMSGDELDERSIAHDESVKEPIVISDASFSWTKDDAIMLKDINLKVEKGKLIAIVGQVGAGKSSLLYALLGNMFKRKGCVNINASIAYVPQQAWIQNASLRNNIIYTNSLDNKRLQQVIDNCELRPDLEILPGGEMTEIGEKGINLSGGQKQRVSMARACYSEADIYLFDDPLSALDAHVGKNIFNNVIGPRGMLRDKTRVLVTHRISVLSQCDQIVVMKDGSISEYGSYKQLLERKGDFAEFMITHLTETDEEIDTEELKMIEQIVKPERQLSRSVSSTEDIRARTLTNVSIASSKSVKDSHHNVSHSSVERNKSGRKSSAKLTEAEKSETGSVKWTVYWEYSKRVGLIGVITVLLTYVFSNTFNIGSSIWLSAWSSDSKNVELAEDQSRRDLRLGVYGALGTAEAIFILIGALTLNISCIKGSKILHNDMMHHILRAPMSFFDTTPMGRILNRFARDVDVCDSMLTMNIRMTTIQFFRAVSSFVVMGIETPLVLLVLLPVGVVYYFIQKLYIPTSRQLRRIESTTRSPIYTHFSETLSGATSIRAYGTVDRFIAESNKRVDVNHSCYYPSLVTSRWLAIRLEFLGYTIIFINAIVAVINRQKISPSVAGLTLSYAMTITRSLNNLVMASTNLETNIVSVERCLEYTKTPLEAEWHRNEFKPRAEWPDRGVIRFDNYSTRYREGLELVLKQISFEVNAGESVGVVGRTGAGKSSLTLALFRIIEPVCGTIYIDNVDITRLGLYDLRSRLTIIPQDPALFTGTLRVNLDPFERHTDEDIWTALELAHLKAFVLSLEAGLNHSVAEGGDNLSAGQKQLICLARAVLRKSRIIVLDEATAAVDIETDELIQNTIRNEFTNCTIVTIAHRLNTIIDYDRVLVMDKGEVAEYDSPQNLINNQNSIFHSMAKDAGLL